MGLRPLACTLTDEEIARVKAEYRASEHLYQAKAQIEGSVAVIVLTGDKEPLGRFLRRMVEREQQCCAFLTLMLEETPDGYLLRLGSDSVNPEVLRMLVEVLFPTVTLAG